MGDGWLTVALNGRLLDGPLVLAGAAVVLVAAFLAGWLAGRASGPMVAGDAGALDRRLAELGRIQAETAGRLATMAEIFGSRQADLARVVADRLDGLGHRLGQSMTEGARATHENLRRLAERMAVIDRADRTISDLTGHVAALERIFSDKQTRGAFGQGRMEAIVRDALPEGAYAFQAGLSNGTRPDCLIRLPNGQPMLAIDAKFPLEAWNRVRAAETPEALKAAETQLRRDVAKHVDDIRARYLIPGETQDTALMFVPSEALFADLHERFGDVVERAVAGRVVIVSPSLLLLSIQVMQSLLRDERMRAQAHVIQAEVRRLVEDVVRLAERAAALEKHFAQAQQDIDQVSISAGKIARRGARIESLDIGREAGGEEAVAPRRAAPQG
ncbi:DNA recombination protein RmuC [Pseudoxanthobacter sp.]|uniref:DNA recombination protein RmuC n=1 Tax=Pseudoxanthobacter sp. TaxID=1925742 RepID=UPI002FDF33E1